MEPGEIPSLSTRLNLSLMSESPHYPTMCAGLATLRQGLADVQRAAREADPRGLSGIGDLLLRDDLLDIMAHNPVLAPCIVQADFMAAVQVFILRPS